MVYKYFMFMEKNRILWYVSIPFGTFTVPYIEFKVVGTIIKNKLAIRFLFSPFFLHAVCMTLLNYGMRKVSQNFVICLIMGHFVHLLSCNRDMDYLLPIYLDFSNKTCITYWKWFSSRTHTLRNRCYIKQ